MRRLKNRDSILLKSSRASIKYCDETSRQFFQLPRDYAKYIFVHKIRETEQVKKSHKLDGILTTKRMDAPL